MRLYAFLLLVFPFAFSKLTIFYPHLISGHKVIRKLNHQEISNRVDTTPRSTRFKRWSDPEIKFTIPINTKLVNISLHANQDLFWENSVIEWFLEDGSRYAYPAFSECLYIGSIDGNKQSIVAVNLCGGLSGLINTDVETLFIEPIRDSPLKQGMFQHTLISSNLWSMADLRNDVYQMERQRRRRRYIESEEESLDEDEYEIYKKYSSVDDFDLVLDEDLGESYEQFEDYMDVEDFNIPDTPNPVEDEDEYEDEYEEDLETSTKQPLQIEEPEVDGFMPDDFWQKVSAAKRPKSRRKKIRQPLQAKWLKMAIIADHTVIKFHGKNRIQQYILTLLNIVCAIYQDPTLHANIKIIINRIIFLEEKKQNVVREFNPKRSLENVNNWNANLLSTLASELKHDVAVWLTRYDLGGPSGYAPVSGVCDIERSCSLNKDEGFTSAFIIAHEVGHVLGFSHDGDTNSKNNCSEDALLGSVMAPMVASTFNRFHWSKCTQDEMRAKEKLWLCMDSPPKKNSKAILVNASIEFNYSLDEQCRMEFGEGYALCKTFAMNDPCTHLWCGHRNSAHLCKTKKGPPLEGTICGTDKWCVKGYCQNMRKRLLDTPVSQNPRDGGWSSWSNWSQCSRSCGLGSQVRARSCNSPPPAYGGRVCQGSREEFRVCAIKSCSRPTDLREEQCARLALITKLDGRQSKQRWHPYEFENGTNQCKLSCISDEGELKSTNENILDGAPCSYEDSNGICIQGNCMEIGCDGLKDSTMKQNECGICGGSSNDCIEVQRYYKGKPKSPFRRMLVIPKGVRNIEVVKTPVEPHILSLRERKGKRWALNNPATAKTKTNQVVYVVSAGARFRYWKEGAKEIIIARGPTLQELLLMVIPGETADPNSSVTITATWTVPKRKGKQIAEKYKWEIAGWSPCSTSCGGGLQRQVLSCRHRSTKKLVKHKFCRAVKKMKVESRKCNIFGCDFRWVVGPWEGCSTTCGTNGAQERQIFCVQTNLRNNTLNNHSSYSFRMKEKFVPLKEKQRDQPFEDGNVFNEEEDYPVEVNITEKYYIQHPKKCKKEKQPDELRSCNRISCPGVWVEGGWKKCTGTCEKSTRELKFACIGVHESENFYNLSAKATEEAFVSIKERSEDFDCGMKPKIKQLCDTKCVEPCESDESKFCMIPLLYKYCSIPGIRQRCCQTCSNYVRNI